MILFIHKYFLEKIRIPNCEIVDLHSQNEGHFDSRIDTKLSKCNNCQLHFSWWADLAENINKIIISLSLFYKCYLNADMWPCSFYNARLCVGKYLKS